MRMSLQYFVCHLTKGNCFNNLTPLSILEGFATLTVLSGFAFISFIILIYAFLSLMVNSLVIDDVAINLPHFFDGIGSVLKLLCLLLLCQVNLKVLVYLTAFEFFELF